MWICIQKPNVCMVWYILNVCLIIIHFYLFCAVQILWDSTKMLGCVFQLEFLIYCQINKNYYLTKYWTNPGLFISSWCCIFVCIGTDVLSTARCWDLISIRSIRIITWSSISLNRACYHCICLVCLGQENTNKKCTLQNNALLYYYYICACEMQQTVTNIMKWTPCCAAKLCKRLFLVHICMIHSVALFLLSTTEIKTEYNSVM